MCPPFLLSGKIFPGIFLREAGIQTQFSIDIGISAGTVTMCPPVRTFRKPQVNLIRLTKHQILPDRMRWRSLWLLGLLEVGVGFWDIGTPLN